MPPTTTTFKCFSPGRRHLSSIHPPEPRAPAVLAALKRVLEATWPNDFTNPAQGSRSSSQVASPLRSADPPGAPPSTCPSHTMPLTHLGALGQGGQRFPAAAAGSSSAGKRSAPLPLPRPSLVLPRRPAPRKPGGWELSGAKAVKRGRIVPPCRAGRPVNCSRRQRGRCAASPDTAAPAAASNPRPGGLQVRDTLRVRSVCLLTSQADPVMGPHREYTLALVCFARGSKNSASLATTEK